MIDHLDWSQINFLDAQAEDYRAKGYKVTYLPYVYGGDFVPLTANATQEVPVTIDPDSDFIVCAQNFTAFTVAGGSLAAPNILIEMKAEGNQRYLQNQPVHLVGSFGVGERPHYLYKPLVLRARGTLQVKAQNLTGTDTNLRLSFIGCKAYLSKR